MNTFVQNQTLKINDTTYTVSFVQKEFIMLNISTDKSSDILFKTLPIKTVGQFEYVSFDSKTLFAKDFILPESKRTIKTYDFTKEDAEKYKEYLLTLRRDLI
jgi:hypothetical protein